MLLSRDDGGDGGSELTSVEVDEGDESMLGSVVAREILRSLKLDVVGVEACEHGWIRCSSTSSTS